ncbi:DUF4105 domain-containing protein [Dyella sp.]|uniref:lipoprotein N-acyltransferase Lnb domain-containing protein n=1 Tax=Dyella sp. TaxID=1869338 RepID=UPI002ED3A69F
MPLIGRLLLLATLILGFASTAHADVANAPGADLEVALITYGPGDTYWERFGHDAIEIRDTVSGEAVNFNYGVFDFDESGFLLNFARGRMHYLMDAAHSEDDEHYYVETGRSVTRQKLALNANQAAALRDFLLWNLRPENARYDYDYYVTNCSTKVRDALDKALGGVLKTQLQARRGSMTYRQQTARLMSAQPWLMLILDLGLGPYADQPLSAWQESFLPMVLQRQLASIQVSDGQGGTHPLATDEQVLSPNRLDTPPDAAPDLRLPLGLAGLAFAMLLVLLSRIAPTMHALLATLYLVLAGIVGVLLLALWLFTTHHSAWANANLLMFNPLAWLLIAAVWRARRHRSPTRLADTALMLQLFMMLAAVAMHLMHGIVQQNQPWLLFALPCWLAMAFTCRKNSRAA